MAKETPAPAKNAPQKQKQKPAHPKLPRLKHSKVQKRPLLHPAIPNPHSSAQKVVYVSASSPFISVIKRVQKLLSEIERRNTGSVDFRKKSSNEILKQVEDGVKKGREKGGEKEEVVVKGTGKAIQKVVSVAAWFQDEGNGRGVRVRLRTGSVGAVDDVVPVEKKAKKLKRGDGDEGGEGGAAEDGDGEEGEDPETQVRRVSCLEVGISLR